MEQPYSLSFQTNTLARSGSISFGRFETESLSWEKHSSFSHNRYLEEIEKFSKPGSVIEKKAILEAHFKKRALLHQNSSLSQDGTECQTKKSYMSGNTDNSSKDTQCANNEDSCFRKSNQNFDHSDGDCEGGITVSSCGEPQAEPASNNVFNASDSKRQTSENHIATTHNSAEIKDCNNEDVHNYHFDENSNDSDSPDFSDERNQFEQRDGNSVYSGHHGGYEEIKVEGSTELDESEFQATLASSSVECVADCASKHLMPKIAHETGNVEEYIELHNNSSKDAMKDTVLLESLDVLHKSRVVEDNGDVLLGHLQILSPKEKEHNRPAPKVQTNSTKIHRSMSRVTSKESSKIPSRSGTHLLRKKTENQASQVSAIATHLRCSTSKPEGSETTKVKPSHESQREYESKGKKIIAPRPCTPEKFESRALQRVNRSNPLINQGNIIDEPAERSKEVSKYTKTNMLHENKRESELKAKKVGASRPSTPQKQEMRARLTANRPKQTVSSANHEVKESPVAFNFNCEKRAVRRREFYTRLEVKVNAREAETNHILAKTQKKAEVEIKEFRRSLNFKATPMPSFYQGTLHVSTHKKAVSANAKSAKSVCHLSSGSRSKSVRAATSSKESKAQDPVHGSVLANPLPSAPHCAIDPSRPDFRTRLASPTSSNCCTEATQQNKMRGRAEQVNRGTSSQNHKTIVVGVTSKGQKTGGKEEIGMKMVAHC